MEDWYFMKGKKVSLAAKIFIGMILGIIAGILLQGNPEFAVNYVKPFGTIFLNLIKTIVVPVVLCSIISGVISMKDIKKVGKVGVKAIIFYTITTCVAVTLGLVFANVLNVGGGFANFINSATDVCIKVMEIVIKLSPIGVFALIAPVVAENGVEVLLPLLKLIVVVYIGYIVHMLVVYSLTAKTIGKISPITFFKGMFPAMTMAFSSASSVGTLPLNLECCESLGAKKEITSFVLPLGATINMDGTAIYQGVCAIFIAQVFGIDLTFGQQLTMVLTATLASIGTAGVPGSGMIMLSMVLQSVGLPVEGIALVAGIDRILDMGRTTVNITGDSACAICISATEKE